MSQWAHENPEEMAEIAALPPAQQNAALRDANRLRPGPDPRGRGRGRARGAGAVKPVKVTTHAVERYRERVKPALTYDQAFEDVVRMLRQHATFIDELPGWAWQLPDGIELDEELLRDFAAVALIGGDIALPLIDKGDVLLAVTCLARSGLPDGARRHVNMTKQRRRRRRRLQSAKADDRASAKLGKRSGRPRREAA